MDIVIQQLEWDLEHADANIKSCQFTVDAAKRNLECAQDRLDDAVESYNRAVSFKEEAKLALTVLRAHEG